MSRTLPGVPTTTWTPSFKFLMSALMEVPPMKAWTLTLRYSPISPKTYNF